MSPVQLNKVIGLKDHVVELKKRELLLTIKAQLDGLETKHAVNREVASDITQEVDIIQLIQPLGIVGHQGCIVAFTKVQELAEHGSDPVQVFADVRLGQQFATLSLPDGSPTRVVPPPISAIGRCPSCCSQ